MIKQQQLLLALLLLSSIQCFAADSLVTSHSRLSIGGYGEATMLRNFYSDNWKRYTDASRYRNAPSFGRADLPHVVIYLNYDFGHGWTMGSEIEFEHGGSGSSIEIEEEETGEYETETERGGEVALEQFWLQKRFGRAFYLRMGHIVVPVGLTNAHHEPNCFFGVFRPEGENTILPSTWHETGFSLGGDVGRWHYEAMLMAGLDADRFSNKGWIHDGSNSPYEFKIANAVACAARLNYKVSRQFTVGLSGYAGNSASNSLKSVNFKGLHGTVLIGSIDGVYDSRRFKAQGCVVFGHLSKAGQTSEINRSLKGYAISSGTNVGSEAISVGLEAGYDVLPFFTQTKQADKKLFLFGRYDYYDSMYRTGKSANDIKLVDEEQWGRQRLAVGLNYYPIKNIVVKTEYAYRIFKSQFNNEPSLSVGIAYAGFFL